MPAQNHIPPMRATQSIHHQSQSTPLLMLLRQRLQRQLRAPPLVIDIAETQRNQTQTDPPLPRPAQHHRQATVNIRLQIRRLRQRLAPLILIHVVITDFHRQRAHRLSFFPHHRHQLVRHAPQNCLQPPLIRHILRKRLLPSIRLRRPRHRHHRTIINPSRKLPHPRSRTPQHQLQQLHRRGRDLPNTRQPSRPQTPCRVRPHPR